MLHKLAPRLRRWARQTKLPLLRHLVESLTSVRDLQARCAIQEAKIVHLYAQLDLLKSAGEIPREWFHEFRSWKDQHPVPDVPLVSVCVATWNRSRLLVERCLSSLIRQSWRHLEIIVVGDHCTDDTADRVAALGDSRIRFVNLLQRGCYPVERLRRWQVAGSVPMNHALGLCKGDYITHLDDDDHHDHTRVEKLVEFAKSNDLDFVWHPFWYEDCADHWQLHPAHEFRLSQVTTSSIFYRNWLARITWDVHAHLLDEPGDWNRLRKFRYLGVNSGRFGEPLLRHHMERSQVCTPQDRPVLEPPARAA